jgi:hypothetical protein
MSSNYQTAQRRYDNELPESQDEPQRVCRCCGEWVDESGFPTERSHICTPCWRESLNEKTLPQPNAVTGETNDEQNVAH